MDKYDLVIDVIEHPEKYSVEQLSQYSNDPEFHEIYSLLCKTASSVKQETVIDTDAEWDRFIKKKVVAKKPKRFFGISTRAASIIIFAGLSLAAVAIGLVVAKHSSVERSVGPDVATSTKQSTEVIDENSSVLMDTSEQSRGQSEPIVFEDSSLRDIMTVIGQHYGMTVTFSNPASADLHLFYKFNPYLPLDEVIGQLNNFEQINIVPDGNNITIE